MNYAQIRKFDVTNGPGIRSTLFVSGCTHNCLECFNKEQQNFKYGNVWTDEIEDEFVNNCNNPQIVGVSILGGEPFQQSYYSLKKLLYKIKKNTNKPIWVWTGYTYEELINDEFSADILTYIDILIDGKFEVLKRDLNLKYRGSSNQRIIDVQQSLTENKVITLNL